MGPEIPGARRDGGKAAEHDAFSALAGGPSLEQMVRTWYDAGRSQRAIAGQLNIDRRKVKRIIDQAA
jgi:hypothetical protein